MSSTTPRTQPLGRRARNRVARHDQLLAAASDIVNESGLSQRTVYTLLNNNYNHDPKISTVSALAKVLGANFMELLSE